MWQEVQQRAVSNLKLHGSTLKCEVHIGTDKQTIYTAGILCIQKSTSSRQPRLVLNVPTACGLMNGLMQGSQQGLPQQLLLPRLLA